MSTDIAKQWLRDAAASANSKNHPAHMDLISKRVNLTGVPGYEAIGYEQWSAQCRHEFGHHLIKSVCHDDLKLLASIESPLMFKTFETVEGTAGGVSAQGVEILLEREDDGAWRLARERILPGDETEHDKLGL
jgi:hypothetical protein